MKSEILELFKEFDTDIIVVSDFGIVANGCQVDCIVLNEGVVSTFVQVWAGNPETDKDAEALMLDEAEQNRVFDEILEYM